MQTSFSISKLKFLSFLLLLLSSALVQGQSWSLKKNEEGIKVYTKPVEDSDIDAFRAIGVVKAKLSSILATLNDADDFCAWMPNCHLARLEKREGKHQYHYVETKTPFPLDNRDCFYHFEYLPGKSQTKITIEGLPKYGPAKDGIVRMPAINGFWLLEPINANETKVTYQLQIDPGGSIPSWVANMGSIDLPFDTLHNMRAHLAKK